MTNITSQSDGKPIEWDVESSPTTVYHNYDIQEIKNEDETTKYQYQTDKMTHQEYSLQLAKTMQEQQKLIQSLEGRISELEQK